MPTTSNTNVIDATDRTATAVIDLTDITATAVIDMRAAHDDTMRIPTYNGEPMLPPVPARRPVFVQPKHRAPSNRPALLLAAVTLGGALAPLVIR